MSILYDMRSGTLVKSKLYSNGLLLKNLLDRDKAIKELFAGDKQGIWLDPSDLSTMFKDAAGTQPVTTDGDPVGLILDKSKGLELGTNKITNGDFSEGLANWSINGGDEATVVNGVFTPTGITRYSNKITLEVGKTYLIETDIDNSGVSSSNNKLRISAHDNNSFSSGNSLGDSYTGRLIIRGHVSTNISIYLFSQSATAITVSNITVREIKGNHATQSVSAARPIYKTDGVLHWLQFDGVDDYLSTSNYSLNGALGVTAFMGLQKTSTLAATGLGYGTGTSGLILGLSSSGAIFDGKPTGGAYYSSTSGSPSSQAVVAGGIYDLQKLQSFSNGIAGNLTLVVATSIKASTGLAVGLVSNNFMAGKFYGLIVVNEVLSSSSRFRVNTYLSKKTGITL